MTTTSGRFDLTSWDEEVYDDADGAKLVRVSSGKTLEGGLAGTSTVHLLQAIGDGSAAYVGIERMVVALDGREGTFVLRHSAVGGAGGGSMLVDVVPGTGTGELVGLSGELTIERSPDGEHTYVFTYALG